MSDPSDKYESDDLLLPTLVGEQAGGGGTIRILPVEFSQGRPNAEIHEQSERSNKHVFRPDSEAAVDDGEASDDTIAISTDIAADILAEQSREERGATDPKHLDSTGRRGVVGGAAREGAGVRTPAPQTPKTPSPRAATPDPTPVRDADILDMATPRPRGAQVGDIIGARYLVDGQIGRGGMGRVLRVRHQVLGKAFALKLIKAPIATDPRIREMFYREAKLASSLSHENVCSIVDFGLDEQFGLFMVMELLEGRTLYHRLAEKGRLAPKVACDIMWQVAEALRYIHDQNIIHGDIKSENILLVHTPERRRSVKLLDFGLARAPVKKRTESIEGTPEYLAPERLYGGPPSVASDIYALGILFYELLIGALPFRGEIEAIFRMQIESPVPKASAQLGGALDERADEIIARATAKAPGERHADVASFMYELRTLMSMLGMRLPGRARGGGGNEARGARRPSTKVRARPQELAGSKGLGAIGEMFERIPLPMAAIDRESKVYTANPAFWKFLGLERPAENVCLRQTALAALYPTMLADIGQSLEKGITLKRVIHIGEGAAAVDVALILTASAPNATVTKNHVYMALHPLSKV